MTHTDRAGERIAQHTETGAIAAGYTSAVIADCSMHTLELLIKPDANLDSRFRAYDRNEGEMITVNGWMFSISPM
ncbi:hypothetical protein [Novosphingobium sp. HII-3]|uniref:hypothetical protein n=1 Tax=Novosphingobium sp. HII-3 TaxID=2075565 RepID=UPI000CDAD6B5|nr:hypothetical protein [Novosphingobium sp. HII-3]